MGRLANLRKGFKQLQGFSYGDNKPIDLAEVLYFSLVDADPSQPVYSVPMVTSNLTNRLTAFFKTCAINDDVYRRLGGDKSFWSFVVASWNPLHPLTPEDVEGLVFVLSEARRRSISASGFAGATILTNAVDSFINLVDEVQSRGPQQQLTSLRGPPNATAQQLSSVWPPAHFTGVDIAMMAVKGVREKMYGITSTNSPAAATTTPTRLDEPLAIRTHLAHLALAKVRPDASVPVAVYLAPVAFLDDPQRTSWYKTTGHKSRLYGTVSEFLEYAHKALISTRNRKKHAVCLLTPWYFEPSAAVDRARERDVTIPTAWAEGCPRTGLALVITRVKRAGGKRAYRVVLFQPGPPRYVGAAEPLERWEAQDAWVEGMLDVVDDELNVQEGHIGGYLLRRYGSGSGNGETPVDSVELACEFVREVVSEPERAVPGGMGLVERGFATIVRWDDDDGEY